MGLEDRISFQRVWLSDHDQYPAQTRDWELPAKDSVQPDQYDYEYMNRDATAADNAPSLSLPTLMKMYGDGHIHILKMDVEGAEISVFKALLNTKELGQMHKIFGQLLVELHLEDRDLKKFQGNTFREMHSLLTRLEDHGFRVFSKEANLGHTLYRLLPCCVEYGLVHLRSRFASNCIRG
eukprot:scaffold44_cov411-Prasinococcus_capsulatus_cf.AAC.38